jgi:hypothetical protein
MLVVEGFAAEVDVRIERVGLDLAEAAVVSVAEQALGQQYVGGGPLRPGSRATVFRQRIPDHLLVVVVRVQAMLGGLGYQVQQLSDIGGVGPERFKLDLAVRLPQ